MANVRVAVRLRPLNDREISTGACNIVRTCGNSLSITNLKVEGLTEHGDSRDRIKHFTFDYCYDSSVARDDASTDFASQELVYQDLGTEVLQAAFDGYNACLFAYGGTGTGKTFTMMGYPGQIGLIPRICESLFSHVNDSPEESITFRVEISYLEIYNERVRDLLRTSLQSERFTLRVREHPKDGPYVEDLSRHLVKNYHEIQTLLDRGNQLRTTAVTHIHEHSSRSHAIVTVTFVQAKLEDDLPSETVSKIHLVDLAGSERADPNYHANYKSRITEGASINKSLNTLGNVIKALAEMSLLAWSSMALGSSQYQTSDEGEISSASRRSRQLYIPYRDSVLTWLLKDSLGGNSKTLMIATITPASKYYNETISTLRYAQRAKSITNKPRINEDANVTLIRKLQQEIKRLKLLLASTLSGNAAAGQDSGDKLSEELKQNEEIANQLTQSWLNKWNETQTLMQDTDLSIRGLGQRSNSYGIIIDSQLPHLIDIRSDDIFSTGIILFHLKEGVTLIGRQDAQRQQDIVIEGPGIQSEHCHLKNRDGQVMLYPHHGAQCSVNKRIVHEATPLSQGDILLLGKANIYRFNNPVEAAKLRQRRQSMQDGDLLSEASSVTSLSDQEVGDKSPLAMFNPKLDSARICLELEHTYANEEERIQQARYELERVQAEVNEREESGHEEEEKLWAEHEKHREELEAEKIRLARLREKLSLSQEESQERLARRQQQLEEEAESYKQKLQQQLKQLTDVHRDSSIEQQVSAVHLTVNGTAETVTGSQCSEIRQRKLSREGQVKDLVQSELLHAISHQQAVRSLHSQELEMEEKVQQAQDTIHSRIEEIQQKMEQYRDADASRLQQVHQKNEHLEQLQRQKEQLELYLEEKQHLIAVGQAEPRYLRGACSELTLAFPTSGSDGFDLLTHRAASESNIGDIDDSVAGALSSDSTLLHSRDSGEPLPDLDHSIFIHRASDSDTSSSQLPCRPDSQSSSSVEMLQGDFSAPSKSAGSKMDSESVFLDSKSSEELSLRIARPSVYGDGRGRSQVRSRRGKIEQLQSRAKLETPTDIIRLTTRAAHVTARLYQPKTPRADLRDNFLKSRRDKDPQSPSASSARQSPSPQPASKSRSPLSAGARRREILPDTHDSLEDVVRKRRNRDERERPWRTRLEPLKKGGEVFEPRSLSQGSNDKSKENWERPWRQRRQPSKDANSTSNRQTASGDPDGRIAGKNSAAESGKRKRRSPEKVSRKIIITSSGNRCSPETAPSSDHVAPAGHLGPKDSSLKSSKRVASFNKGSGARDSSHRNLPLTSSSTEELRSSGSSSEPCHVGRPLGGSDGSLYVNNARQQRLRPRFVPRLISSASSLPSVPEAAAESDHDLTPMTFEPNMATLAAAGGGQRHEKDVRRHSEPVGKKMIQELVWYAAHKQNHIGGAGLPHRMDHDSSVSSSSCYDSESTLDIPRISLTEPSSSSGGSSQENFLTVCGDQSVMHHGQEELVEAYPSPREADLGQPENVPVIRNQTADRASGLTDAISYSAPRLDDDGSYQQKEAAEIVLPGKNGHDHHQCKEQCLVKKSDSTSAVIRSTPDQQLVIPDRAELTEVAYDDDDLFQGGNRDSEEGYSADSLDDEADLCSPRSSRSISQTHGDFLDLNTNINHHSFTLHTSGLDSGNLVFHALGNVQHVEQSGDAGFALHDNLSNECTYYVPAFSGSGDSAPVLDTVKAFALTSPSCGASDWESELPFWGSAGQGHLTGTDAPENNFSRVVFDLKDENPEAPDRVQSTFESVKTQGAKELIRVSGSTGSGAESSEWNNLLDICITQSNNFPSWETRLHTITSCAEPVSLGAPHQSNPRTSVTLALGNGGSQTRNAVINQQVEGESPKRSNSAIDEAGLCSGNHSETPNGAEILPHKEKEDSAIYHLPEKATFPSAACQEMPQQLSPRSLTATQVGNSTTNGTNHIGSNRRCRRRALRHVKGTNSASEENSSDESQAHGANSCTSRPGSGSRRRRRHTKAPDAVIKKHYDDSPEQCITPDSENVLSDYSLPPSAEHHEASPSQVADLMPSVEQFTVHFESIETLTRMDSEQNQGNLERDGMADQDRPNVPELVSYFESQVSRQQDHVRKCGQSPKVSQVKQSGDFSITSAYSRGHDISDSTQTEGSSLVMSKGPVSVLSAGDPYFSVSESVLHALSGEQNIFEESSIRARSLRSWKLSISPTDTWHSQTAMQMIESASEVDVSDVTCRRRKSKPDVSASPEKRHRQDKLTDLHSKYGLMEEADRISDEDEISGAVAATWRQHSHQSDPVLFESFLHKKAHEIRKDQEGKLHFEVTICQDETKVLYNVEKTEYKTYALRDSEGKVTEETTFSTVPDAINIDLIETTTRQCEDHFETVTREHIIFDGDNKIKDERDDDVIILEHKFTGDHRSVFEQENEDGNVSRENSVERHQTSEDVDSTLKTRNFNESLLVETGSRTESTACLPVEFSQINKFNLSEDIDSPTLLSDSEVAVDKNIACQLPNTSADFGKSGHSDMLDDPNMQAAHLRKYSSSSGSLLLVPCSSHSWHDDSDTVADSGITEVSASESLTSHDEDGPAVNVPTSSATVDSKAAMLNQRGYIFNQGNLNRSEDVAYEMHQDWPEQDESTQVAFPPMSPEFYQPFLKSEYALASIPSLVKCKPQVNLQPGRELSSSLYSSDSNICKDSTQPVLSGSEVIPSSLQNIHHGIDTDGAETVSGACSLGIGRAAKWKTKISVNRMENKAFSTDHDTREIVHIQQQSNKPVLNNTDENSEIQSNEALFKDMTQHTEASGDEYGRQIQVKVVPASDDVTKIDGSGEMKSDIELFLVRGINVAKTLPLLADQKTDQSHTFDQQCSSSGTKDNGEDVLIDKDRQFIPAHAWLGADTTLEESTHCQGKNTDTMFISASNWFPEEFAQQTLELPPAVTSTTIGTIPLQQATVIQGEKSGLQEAVKVMDLTSEDILSCSIEENRESSLSQSFSGTDPTQETYSGRNANVLSGLQHGDHFKEAFHSENVHETVTSVATPTDISTTTDLWPDEVEAAGDARQKEGERQQPSVEKLNLESVEQLPLAPVLHVSESAVIYPCSSDDVLHYASSLCSEEPYVLIDTAAVTTGAASKMSSFQRSEQSLKEAVVVVSIEMRRNDCRDSQYSKEDSDLSEHKRTDIITSDKFFPLNTSHNECEHLQGHLATESEVSFPNVQRYQNFFQRSLSNSSRENAMLNNGQPQDFVENSVTLTESHSALSTEDFVSSNARPDSHHCPIETAEWTDSLAQESEEQQYQEIGSARSRSSQENLHSPITTIHNSSHSNSDDSDSPQQSSRGRSSTDRTLVSSEKSEARFHPSSFEPRGSGIQPQEEVINVLTAEMETESKVQDEQRLVSHERCLHSLSDSAFSSDYNESESASVSPPRIPANSGAVYSTFVGDGLQHMFLIEEEHLLTYAGRKEDREDQEKIPAVFSDTHLSKKTARGESVTQNVSPDTFRFTQHSTVSDSGLTKDRANHAVESFAGEKDTSVPSQDITAMNQDVYPFSKTVLLSTDSQVKDENQIPHEPNSLPGKFGNFHELDKIPSVQQSRCLRTLDLYHHTFQTQRGIVQRRVKSLNDLTKLVSDLKQSNLKEDRQQDKFFPAWMGVPEHADHTGNVGWAQDNFANVEDNGTSCHQEVEELLPNETLDSTHGHQFLPTIPHCDHDPVEKEIESTLDSEEEKGPEAPDLPLQSLGSVLLAESDQPLTAEILKSITEQFMEQMACAALARHGKAETQASLHSGLLCNTLSSQQNIQMAPALAVEVEGWQSQSPDTDSDSMVHGDHLLSSGELELAAISARTAAMTFYPDTDFSSVTRALSPGEEILAEILARQGVFTLPGNVNFDNETASSRLNDQPGICGSGPRLHLPSSQEGCLCPQELALPAQVARFLQELCKDSDGSESVEDLLQSGFFQVLESADLSFGQQRMLKHKTLSADSLGCGRYVSEEEEQECWAWQGENSASLSCLEGLVIEDHLQDNESSADSICYVFMGQESSKRAPYLSSSLTPSDDSETVCTPRRLTENTLFEGSRSWQSFAPPLSQRTASLNSIYTASSTSVHEKKWVHRSRSASLLDVCTDVLDDEPIFPPQAYADSVVSWEELPKPNIEDEQLSQDIAQESGSIHTDISIDVVTTTIPATSSIKQRPCMSCTDETTDLVESHSSQFVNIGATVCRDVTGQIDSAIMEGESGNHTVDDRPYLTKRRAGTHREFGGQTDITSENTPQPGGLGFTLIKGAQTPGSSGGLDLASIPVSREQQQKFLPTADSGHLMELSQFMVETTQILRSLQQHLPAQTASRSQASCEGPKSTSFPSGDDFVSTATQTDAAESMTAELSVSVDLNKKFGQISERARQMEQILTPSDESYYLLQSKSQQPQVIILKVKDALTQTVSVLDLTAAEVQTDKDCIDQNSVDVSIRPSMRDASSNMEKMSLVSFMSQTDQTHEEMSAGITTREASSSMEKLESLDSPSQTDDSSGSWVIPKKTKEASSSYDRLNVSTASCQTDVAPDSQLNLDDGKSVFDSLQSLDPVETKHHMRKKTSVSNLESYQTIETTKTYQISEIKKTETVSSVEAFHTSNVTDKIDHTQNVSNVEAFCTSDVTDDIDQTQVVSSVEDAIDKIDQTQINSNEEIFRISDVTDDIDQTQAVSSMEDFHISDVTDKIDQTHAFSSVEDFHKPDITNKIDQSQAVSSVEDFHTSDITNKIDQSQAVSSVKDFHTSDITNKIDQSQAVGSVEDFHTSDIANKIDQSQDVSSVEVFHTSDITNKIDQTQAISSVEDFHISDVTDKIDQTHAFSSVEDFHKSDLTDDMDQTQAVSSVEDIHTSDITDKIDQTQDVSNVEVFHTSDITNKIDQTQDVSSMEDFHTSDVTIKIDETQDVSSVEDFHTSDVTDKIDQTQAVSSAEDFHTSDVTDKTDQTQAISSVEDFHTSDVTDEIDQTQNISSVEDFHTSDVTDKIDQTQAVSSAGDFKQKRDFSDLESLHSSDHKNQVSQPVKMGLISSDTDSLHDSVSASQNGQNLWTSDITGLDSQGLNLKQTRYGNSNEECFQVSDTKDEVVSIYHQNANSIIRSMENLQADSSEQRNELSEPDRTVNTCDITVETGQLPVLSEAGGVSNNRENLQTPDTMFDTEPSSYLKVPKDFSGSVENLNFFDTVNQREQTCHHRKSSLDMMQNLKETDVISVPKELSIVENRIESVQISDVIDESNQSKARDYSDYQTSFTSSQSDNNLEPQDINSYKENLQTSVSTNQTDQVPEAIIRDAGGITSSFPTCDTGSQMKQVMNFQGLVGNPSCDASNIMDETDQVLDLKKIGDAGNSPRTPLSIGSSYQTDSTSILGGMKDVSTYVKDIQTCEISTQIDLLHGSRRDLEYLKIQETSKGSRRDLEYLEIQETSTQTDDISGFRETRDINSSMENIQTSETSAQTENIYDLEKTVDNTSSVKNLETFETTSQTNQVSELGEAENTQLFETSSQTYHICEIEKLKYPRSDFPSIDQTTYQSDHNSKLKELRDAEGSAENIQSSSAISQRAVDYKSGEKNLQTFEAASQITQVFELCQTRDPSSCVEDILTTDTAVQTDGILELELTKVISSVKSLGTACQIDPPSELKKLNASNDLKSSSITSRVDQNLAVGKTEYARISIDNLQASDNAAKKDFRNNAENLKTLDATDDGTEQILEFERMSDASSSGESFQTFDNYYKKEQASSRKAGDIISGSECLYTYEICHDTDQVSEVSAARDARINNRKVEDVKSSYASSQCDDLTVEISMRKDVDSHMEPEVSESVCQTDSEVYWDRLLYNKTITGSAKQNKIEVSSQTVEVLTDWDLSPERIDKAVNCELCPSSQNIGQEADTVLNTDKKNLTTSFINSSCQTDDRPDSGTDGVHRTLLQSGNRVQQTTASQTEPVSHFTRGQIVDTCQTEPVSHFSREQIVDTCQTELVSHFAIGQIVDTCQTELVSHFAGGQIVDTCQTEPVSRFARRQIVDTCQTEPVSHFARGQIVDTCQTDSGVQFDLEKPGLCLASSVSCQTEVSSESGNIFEENPANSRFHISSEISHHQAGDKDFSPSRSVSTQGHVSESAQMSCDFSSNYITAQDAEEAVSSTGSDGSSSSLPWYVRDSVTMNAADKEDKAGAWNVREWQTAQRQLDQTSTNMVLSESPQQARKVDMDPSLTFQQDLGSQGLHIGTAQPRQWENLSEEQSSLVKSVQLSSVQEDSCDYQPAEWTEPSDQQNSATESMESNEKRSTLFGDDTLGTFLAAANIAPAPLTSELLVAGQKSCQQIVSSLGSPFQAILPQSDHIMSVEGSYFACSQADSASLVIMEVQQSTSEASFVAHSLSTECLPGNEADNIQLLTDITAFNQQLKEGLTDDKANHSETAAGQVSYANQNLVPCEEKMLKLTSITNTEWDSSGSGLFQDSQQTVEATELELQTVTVKPVKYGVAIPELIARSEETSPSTVSGYLHTDTTVLSAPSSENLTEECEQKAGDATICKCQEVKELSKPSADDVHETLDSLDRLEPVDQITGTVHATEIAESISHMAGITTVAASVISDTECSDVSTQRLVASGKDADITSGNENKIIIPKVVSAEKGAITSAVACKSFSLEHQQKLDSNLTDKKDSCRPSFHEAYRTERKQAAKQEMGNESHGVLENNHLQMSAATRAEEFASQAPIVNTGSETERRPHQHLILKSETGKQRMAVEEKWFLEDKLLNSYSVEESIGSGELSFRCLETLEEVREFIQVGHMKSLESGPTMIEPSNLSQIVGASNDISFRGQCAESSIDNETKVKDSLGSIRGLTSEQSYKLDEKLDLSRSLLMMPSEERDILFLESSLAADDMFWSEAQQRAAWRAREGDYGLTTEFTSSHGNQPGLQWPVLRSRGEDVSQADFATFSSQSPMAIMNEIDKLHLEHYRMMLLLKRSRHSSCPPFRHLYHSGSASPSLTSTGSRPMHIRSHSLTASRKKSHGGLRNRLSASQSTPISASGMKEMSSRSPASEQDLSIAANAAANSLADHLYYSLQLSPFHPTVSGIDSASSSFNFQDNHSATSEQIPSVINTFDTSLITNAATGAHTQTQATCGSADSEERREQGLEVEWTLLNAASDVEQPLPEKRKQWLDSSEGQIPRSAGSCEEYTGNLSDRVQTLSVQNELSQSCQDQATVSSWKDEQFVRHQKLEVSSEEGHWWDDDLPARQQQVMRGDQIQTSRQGDVSTKDTQSLSMTMKYSEQQSEAKVTSADHHQRLHTQNQSAADLADDIAPVMHHNRNNVQTFLRKDQKSFHSNVFAPDNQWLLTPSYVSTGVVATVDILDDFTQTNDEDAGSLHLSQLNDSRTLSRSGNDEIDYIRAELDRLHQERVEIIELLSLQYLPASLTVELLEAKLNYCLGQTDMLLDSLEKACSDDELCDSTTCNQTKQLELLTQYRLQFEHSRQDLKVCIEEAKRLQNGTRGRRKVRTRDRIAMQRRAEIEAFKQERMREQALFERHRNFSPSYSDNSSSYRDSTALGRSFVPYIMTPKQHKEHLVQLRRSLVAASTEELNELRQRSRSNSKSPSPSPDRLVSPNFSADLHQPFRASDSSQFLEHGSFTTSFISTSESTQNLHMAASAHRIPRLVLPTSDPIYNQGYPLPRQRLAHLSPRSSSCGSAFSPRHMLHPNHLAPPLILTDESYSDLSNSLDPEQLLKESYAVRQLNREQISKAQEALRLLEEQRKNFQIQSRLQGTNTEIYSSSSKTINRIPITRDHSAAARLVGLVPTTGGTVFSEEEIEREIRNLQQQYAQSSDDDITELDSGIVSFSIQESSNNMASEFCTSQDSLRHTLTINTDARRTSDYISNPESRTDIMETAKALDDSLLHLSASSGAITLPQLTSSRPISSQDIKARISHRQQQSNKNKNE